MYRATTALGPRSTIWSRAVLFGGLGVTALSGSAFAGGKQVLEELVVTAQAITEIGVADSANVGTVTQEQLAARTVYRPGELLETTPGLIVLKA